MSEFLTQRLSLARTVPPWLWWTGLFLLLALMPTSKLLSQDGPGQYFSELGDNVADVDEATDGGLFYSDAFTGRSGQAFGAVGRGTYLTGPGVGREKGLAAIEFMPYMFFDQGMFFADIRGFRGDAGDYGANTGLGYRHYVEPIDRIFGVNFFNDYDNTSGTLFRQWGFGIETLGRWLDARANAYYPYGERSRLLRTDLVDGSQRFVNHFLLFDLVNTFGSSLRGGDAEIGVPIPGEFTQRHDVRVYAGGYWYDSTAPGSEFAGWSGRLQGELIPSLLLQLQVTNDARFDTNLVFAATWSFGGFKQPEDEPRNQFNRMTTRVQRQYNIAVLRQQILVPGVIARNPATGNPFFFEHVASYPPNGTGTVLLPWQTIDQAELVVPQNGDGIIFVHADSFYDGDLDLDGNPDNIVELISNVRYFGEGDGIVHTLNVQGVGNVDLPRATNGVSRPLLINGVGDGVTLANSTEFSGFLIGDSATPGSGPTGNGVFGNGIANVTLDQNEFNFAGLAGMLFLNTTGQVDSDFTRIFNPGGVALDVDGGTPAISFRGDATANTGDITNDGNIAFRVQNTAAGSFVNLTGSDINNSNSVAQGVFINNVAGIVTVNDAVITNAGTFGIEILDSSGTFTFRGGINITNPADNAVQITNLADIGFVNFNATAPVTISLRNQSGFNFFNDAGDIFVFGTVNIGEPVVDGNGDPTSTAAAINWQNNSGLVQFAGDVNINGSGGDGIALGTNTPNTGTFQTRSNINISGGPNNVGIRGIGINIADNTAASNISFGNGASVAGRFNEGIQIVDNAGLVTFGGTAQVTNGFASIESAINITGNTGDILFSTIDIQDATSNGVDGYGAGMNVVDNIASVSVQDELNIDNTINGLALFVLNAGDIPNETGGFFVNDGNITDGTLLPAIDIENSRINITFREVNVANSARQGIRLVDNAGIGTNFDFVITGTPNQLAAGTGGTIETSVLQGVLVDSQGDPANDGGVANGITGLSVSLTNMEINSNGLAGVRSVANQRMDLTNNTLDANGTFGLHAIDTRFVNVALSRFSNNGGAGNNNFNQILLEVDTLDADPVDEDDNVPGDEDDYEWTLTENDITATTGGDAVLIRSNATASDADLIFQELGDFVRIGNTTIDKTVAGTHIIWDGTLDALFGVVARNNDFEGNQYFLTGNPDAGNGKIGIQIETTTDEPQESTDIRILSNRITSSSGDNHTAIVIDSDGAADIDIDQESRASVGNFIDLNPGQTLNATREDGMNIAVGAGSDVVIANTQMTLSGNVGTAFIFSDIESTPGNATSIELTGNTVDFDNLFFANTAVGVDFQTVRGGNFVFLSSRANNVFTANVPGQTEFLPINNPGLFIGTFLINGQTFP